MAFCYIFVQTGHTSEEIAIRLNQNYTETTVVKRSTKSKVFIMSLNSLLLAVFIISAWCYADSIGEDPLALLFIYVISAPTLLVLGIILLFYGKHFQVPVFNRLIPFVGIVALTAPIFGVSGFPHTYFISRYFPTFGYDYRTIGLVGTYIGISLSILTVATTVAIVVSEQNRNQTSRPK